MSDSPQNTGGVEDARQATAARLIHPVDAVISGILLALCAWLWYETTQFEEVSFLLADNLPPATFPRIIIVTIAAFTIFMPFEHLLLARVGKNIDKDRTDPVKPITWSTMGLLIAIMAASEIIGTVLTLAAVCLLVPYLWGERRLHVIIPFAILFPSLVTLVFNVFLGVYFPPGPLGLNFQ